MRRHTTLALAAALLVGTAGGARGQEAGTGGPRVGRFDVGVYAGGAFTSRWFESRTVTLNGTEEPTQNDDEEIFKPGYSPAFGAALTFWATPAFGARLHGAYVPMRLPAEPSDGFFDLFDNAGERQAYTLNTYVYDLSLIVRPFVMREGAGIWRSVYLWAGGGGVTVDPAGEDRPACQPTLAGLGACLSYEPEQATVAQGTAGAGMDLFRLGGGLVVFGEAGVHVYDSPVHVGDEWLGVITAPTGATVRVADDRTAVTTRIVAGLKWVFGDLLPAPVPAPAPPPPPPPPAPEVVPPPPPPPALREVRVCVVQDGELREETRMFDPARPDTTYGHGAPDPGPGYAVGTPWFVNNEPITFEGRRYMKYGLPRVLGIGEVRRIGEYRGVGVYAAVDAGVAPDVVYLPVRPGCEFQPYYYEVKTGGVRG